MVNRAVGRLVVDGQAGPTYEGQGYTGLAVMGFMIWLREGLMPYLSSPVHGVSDPVFSPDGQHLAHTARLGAGDVKVILDNRPVATFDTVPPSSLAFSPDGAHLAAIGLREEALVELRDGATFAELTSEDDINIAEHLIWSPDSRRTAFVIGTGGRGYLGGGTTMARRRVVVDGKVGPESDCEPVVGPVFSADSRHSAYGIVNDDERESASFVVVDGVEGKVYTRVYSLQMTGDTVVYVVQDSRRFVRVTRELLPGTESYRVFQRPDYVSTTAPWEVMA